MFTSKLLFLKTPENKKGCPYKAAFKILKQLFI